MLSEAPELQPQYQGRTYGRQDPHASHSAKHAIQNQFFNPFYDPDQTNYTLYPDLHHSSIVLWTGYWLRYGKDPLGYEYHFLEPSQALHRKAMDYLSDMNVMQDFKLRIESKNESTIQTFQKEFRNMYQEIDQLKGKAEDWRIRYENDTGSLMEICQKQKEELQKWSSGKTESKDTSDLETVKRECESWKQKCLELQVETMQHKRSQTLQGENGEPVTDKDLELEKLQKYVLQLQNTIMQQRQQIQEQNGGAPLKRVDSWESVNSTWRTVSEQQDRK
jgi:hypothetical protein